MFPEGSKGPGKTYNERYRLRRFGRGGFVEIAMRAGVPIIPIAVVGSEEAMPVLFKVPAVAKLAGLPYFPITANTLALGPLGALAYFPTKFKIRVLEPVTFDVPSALILAFPETFTTRASEATVEWFAIARPSAIPTLTSRWSLPRA